MIPCFGADPNKPNFLVGAAQHIQHTAIVEGGHLQILGSEVGFHFALEHDHPRHVEGRIAKRQVIDVADILRGTARSERERCVCVSFVCVCVCGGGGGGGGGGARLGGLEVWRLGGFHTWRLGGGQSLEAWEL